MPSRRPRPSGHRHQRLQRRPAEEAIYGFTLLSKPYTVEALSRALRVAGQGRRPRA